MNRKWIFITMIITMLMLTYWLGAASTPPASRSAESPQAMFSKGDDETANQGQAQPDAGDAGQVLLYEPAREASIKTTLDNADNAGAHASITIGSDGLPLISYNLGLFLRIAHCGDLACTNAFISTVGATAEDTSITIGSNGLGVISFYSPSNGDLLMARCLNVTCNLHSLALLDSSGDVGRYNSIDIGADGFPIISYYDTTNRNLKFADCHSFDCAGLTIRTLDSVGDVGEYTSLTRNILGGSVISYYDATNTNLKVLACTTDSCASIAHRTIVDTTPLSGLHTSIALGADNKPVISYVQGGGGTSKLKVGHCADVTCTSLDVKSLFNSNGSGISSSIAIGLDGIPLVSHYNQNNLTLNLLRCLNTDCSEGNYNTIIDTGNLGPHTSMTVGVDGLPIMSYQVQGAEALKVTHCGNPFCKDFQRRR